MFTVKRLNHAVFYVRDAKRAFEFYRDVPRFEVFEARGERACFVRANVDTLPDLAHTLEAPARAHALTASRTTATNSLSVYAQDPDGNEFEVF